MSNIFGQTPSDVSGALFQHHNLADVPDKALARENLNVPSKEDVLYSGAPLGAIMPYLGQVAPAGYLPCYGQTISSTSFPDLVEFLNPGGSTAVIPDMRGEFLRGWDDGRGVDLGRGLGTYQGESIQRHNHYLPTGTGSVANPYPTLPDNLWVSQTVNRNPTSTTEATTYPNSNYLGDADGGTTVGNLGTFSKETRPRNVAVLYCIKAYSSIENISSSVNLPGLISEYSALSADASRISYFLQNQSLTGNGYQRLPGGLIIQWGSVNIVDISTYNASTGPGTASQVSATYPVTFPTKTLSVSATTTGSIGQFGDEAREHVVCAEFNPGTGTGLTLRATRIWGHNSGNESLTVTWIALGH